MESDIGIINYIHNIKKMNWRFSKWEKWKVESYYS